MEDVSEKITERKWHSVDIKGKWLLSYKVGNSQGPSAFGGYNLSHYPNPFTGEKTYLRNVDRQALSGYMIDKLSRFLFPEENHNDKLLISWLICHPDVNIVGVADLDEKIIRKKKTSKITLTYVDYQEVNEFEQEDFIDKLVGLISLDKGTRSLGMSKLRYVMAYLNLTYRVTKYNSKPEIEKKALRSKLKSFIRKDFKNAKLMSTALNKIDEGKIIYEFKEMVRLKIIGFSNGVYKFKQTPLGTSVDAVLNFMGENPEIRTDALTTLYTKIN